MLTHDPTERKFFASSTPIVHRLERWCSITLAEFLRCLRSATRPWFFLASPLKHFIPRRIPVDPRLIGTRESLSVPATARSSSSTRGPVRFGGSVRSVRVLRILGGLSTGSFHAVDRRMIRSIGSRCTDCGSSSKGEGRMERAYDSAPVVVQGCRSLFCCPRCLRGSLF